MPALLISRLCGGRSTQGRGLVGGEGTPARPAGSLAFSVERAG
jgi:hypothetical protein